MSAGVRSALAAMALLLALAGCKTAPPPVIGPGADAPWNSQYAQLSRLNQYSVTGRVAVAASGEGFNANLRFRREPGRSDLALDGPLGMGGLRVTLTGEQLEVFDSSGQRVDGPGARAQLESRLGVELPIEALHWWLLGVPAPGPAERHQVESDEIVDFDQHGWHVTIDARQPALGFALPQRLTATREGARIRLLVDQWKP